MQRNLKEIECEMRNIDARLYLLELQLFRKANFNPAQPRVPAGDPDGGQWTRIPGWGGKPPSPDAIDEIYPEIFFISLLPSSRLYHAWRNWRRVANAQWILGGFKSATRWANQIANRNWTPKEITETIEKGRRFKAPNNVNPGNPAMRYENPKTGKFVVRDEVTKEILQVSGEDKRFKILKFPSEKALTEICYKIAIGALYEYK